MINMRLAESRNLDNETIQTIENLHTLQNGLVELMRESLEDVELLNVLYKQWKDNEYLLQSLWRFPKDKNMHRDYMLPGCSCPKIDNEDLRGTSYRIYTEGCKLNHYGVEND